MRGGIPDEPDEKSALLEDREVESATNRFQQRVIDDIDSFDKIAEESQRSQRLDSLREMYDNLDSFLTEFYRFVIYGDKKISEIKKIIDRNLAIINEALNGIQAHPDAGETFDGSTIMGNYGLYDKITLGWHHNAPGLKKMFTAKPKNPFERYAYGLSFWKENVNGLTQKEKTMLVEDVLPLLKECLESISTDIVADTYDITDTRNMSEGLGARNDIRLKNDDKGTQEVGNEAKKEGNNVFETTWNANVYFHRVEMDINDAKAEKQRQEEKTTREAKEKRDSYKAFGGTFGEWLNGGYMRLRLPDFAKFGISEDDLKKNQKQILQVC